MPVQTATRIGVATWLLAGATLAQGVVSTPQTGAPVSVPAIAHGVRNDLPQPYDTTRDWAQLPSGIPWAAVTAVEPSPDGSIYLIHRCFANSCAGRSEPPILKFDASGKLLAELGPGHVPVPARRHGGSQRQSLGHRRTRWRRPGPSGR